MHMIKHKTNIILLLFYLNIYLYTKCVQITAQIIKTIQHKCEIIKSDFAYKILTKIDFISKVSN